MQSEAIVQSPAIGNALRQALSLDAAGGFPMDAGSTVHPVVVVADVRAQLNNNVRSFSGYRAVAAAAAQFSKVSFQTDPIAARIAGLLYAIPRRVQFYVNAGTTIYWRLGLNTPPAGVDAPTRSLNSQLAGSTGTCAVVGGTDGAAVTPANMQGLIQPSPGVQKEWNDIPEMRLYPDPVTNTSLVFYSDTALVQLVVEVLWDEYYK